jgi:cobalamin biosynthetic protein CobC
MTAETRFSGVLRVTDHGGALGRAAARFGGGDDWLDLSTGINPWPYPVPSLAPEAWHRLPDEVGLDALKAAARGGYGAPAAASLAVAPGSQALIQCLPRLMRPCHVAVVGPTYAEHARCWRLAGHRVSEVEDLFVADADVVVVVNPNNPDGRCLSPGQLTKAAVGQAARGGLLVVDEAFAEVTPTCSMVSRAGMAGLVVLRSFGKFFGLAGLRLGFAFAPADLVERIEDAFGPWAVAGPALEIGRTALGDAAWITATRTKLVAAAADLDRLLAKHGLDVLGGTALFRFVRTARAEALYEQLGRRHILIRAFAATPERVRFGLVPRADAMARLDDALSEMA